MILFSLLWIVVAGFIAFTIIIMLIQMVLFGTVFHTVTRHVAKSLDAQLAADDAARRALTCEFCGAARMNPVDACTGCGAPPAAESLARPTPPNG